MYIINMFKMRLLKHSSIDIDGISHISILKVDQDKISFLITDEGGKISTWQTKTNKVPSNIQTVCAEHDLEIYFELKRVSHYSDDEVSKYLMVYQEDLNGDLLMVKEKQILVKQFDESKDETLMVDVTKFNITRNGKILFSSVIQKNEGAYILVLTDTYDLYIDRYDQLTEQSAPLIMVNIIENSELNGKEVSSNILENLLQGRKIMYDDNYKMIYVIIHEQKKILSWFINDMLRNSRFYTYGSNQDTYRPGIIPIQC